MLVKELKKLLEGMVDEREIVFNICDGERVVSSGGKFLEVCDFGDGGYMLEVLDDDGMDYEIDEDGEEESDEDKDYERKF